MIPFAEILRAREVLAGVAHRTPVVTSRTLDARCGNAVFLKAECLQRTGSFKIRGAYHAIASLGSDERRRGVVAHSSGNHAQAVALAARELGVRAVVVMPANARAHKRAAAAGYGAEIVSCEDSLDDRERVAARLAAERGLAPIPPFDDDRIMAGQGTVAVELIEEAKTLDVLLVPVGGGGLIGGCAVAAKHLLPGVRVIGVEPEAADDARRSLREGRIVRIPPPATIADGLRTQAVGVRNFAILRALVDDIVTVTDAQVVDAMRFLFERLKLVAEPTGAVAPAAALFHVRGAAGRRVGAIVSGGNLDAASFAGLVGG